MNTRDSYSIHSFLQSLEDIPDVKVNNKIADTRSVTEIIISVLSSTALIVLANAVRDLAQKKKIHMILDLPDGTHLDVTEQGNALSSDSLVGYLSKGIERKEIESVEKEIKEHPLELKLKIDK